MVNPEITTKLNDDLYSEIVRIMLNLHDDELAIRYYCS